MIRAGIIGGLHPAAGHLIRLLIHHPDVELMWVCAPEAEGHLLSSAHRGLIGESYMRFCSQPDMEQADVLFLCHTDDGESTEFMTVNDVPAEMRIIDLSPDFRFEPEEGELPEQWIYALPELNRKPLVRGARKAAIPGGMAAAVLLGLLPMAKNLLLNSPIHASVLVPSNEDMPPAYPVAYLDHDQVDEISHSLRQLQTSFNSPVEMLATAAGWQHGIVATMYFDTPMQLNAIRDIYDEFYEDHSFTFISDSLPDLREVAGSNRCVIYLEKVKSKLVVTTVIDDVYKGSAGAAIHAMNLLFGLQERVGL